jgi:hypothetical protein
MRIIQITPMLVSRAGERLKCLACAKDLAQEKLAWSTVGGRNGKKNYLCLTCGYKPVLVYQFKRFVKVRK